MDLLKQLLEMVGSSKNKKPKTRSFVAKHAQRSGAGVHKDKSGVHAARRRQKQQWKKEEGL